MASLPSPRRTALYVLAIVVCVSAASDFRHRAAARRRAAAFVHATNPVVGSTVQEAAASLATPTGRPSIVILYSAHCSISQDMFTAFAEMAARHPEVDVRAFDVYERQASEIPAFLREHGADFTPEYLYDWPKGQLIAAMAPLGIKVGNPTFTTPLVAIRDKDGRVVLQGEEMTDVKGMERALERLRRP